MGIIPIVLAVLLVGAAMALKGKGPLQAVLAAIALGVLTFGMIRGPGGPKLELSEYEEVAGWTLGQAMMDDGVTGGLVLVLRNPSPIKSDDPTSGRFRGLEVALSGADFAHAGPDPMNMGPPDGDFTILAPGSLGPQVVDWVKQYPDAAAVVSLLFEFPDVSAQWSKDLPPIYGFSAGPSPAWAQAMHAGWLKSMVRYQAGKSSRDIPPKGASRQEVFDLRFELVTPDGLRDAVGDSRR